VKELTKEFLLKVEIKRLEKVLSKAYEILHDVDVVGTGYSELISFDRETEQDLSRFNEEV